MSHAASLRAPGLAAIKPWSPFLGPLLLAPALRAPYSKSVGHGDNSLVRIRYASGVGRGRWARHCGALRTALRVEPGDDRRPGVGTCSACSLRGASLAASMPVWPLRPARAIRQLAPHRLVRHDYEALGHRGRRLSLALGCASRVDFVLRGAGSDLGHFGDLDAGDDVLGTRPKSCAADDVRPFPA